MKRPAPRTRRTPPAAAPGSGRQLTWQKKLLFSALCTTAFFLGLELMLWVVGVQPAYYDRDPYQGFARHLAHFVPETPAGGPTQLVVAPAKKEVLNPQQFPLQKPDGSYRIVCLGGSTVYGRPFYDATSIAGWLRELLPAADPSRRWEVINAGGISYASYRVRGLQDELARYEPDLFVVYTGHNEFLERRTYARLANQPSQITGALSQVFRTRTAALLEHVLQPLRSVPTNARPTAQVDDEVRRIPLNAVGPEAYHRDDPFAASVVRHFRASLQGMVGQAQRSRAEILFLVPAANLTEFAPIKSEHSAGLSPASVQQFNSLWRSAKTQAERQEWQAAYQSIQSALAIDDRFAHAHYLAGQIQRQLGQLQDAEKAFARARDEDICPLRAIQPIVDAVRAFRDVPYVMLVDFEQMVRDLRRDGMADRDLFHDHVHLTIDANRRAAIGAMTALAERGIVQLADDWQSQVVPAAAERIQSRLDPTSCAEQLRQLTAMLVWLDQIPLARHQAELSLSYSGQTPESLLAMGQTILGWHCPELARDYFRRAREAMPDSGDARFGEALCELRQGNFQPAREQLEDLLQRVPSWAAAHRALGEVLIGLQQLDEAERHLATAAQLGPEPAEDFRCRAALLAAQNRPADAITYCQRALLLTPEAPELHRVMAACLEQLGKTAEAQRHDEIARRLNPRVDVRGD